ncbi:ABC transporter ATP-binding protein [Candidatus Saccharibacteria bacterium]|nr:ABC transporter ATP-binding protein [Candidatus Saccharibacteria bacterium]
MSKTTDTDDTLSLKARLRVSLRTLKLSWQLRPKILILYLLGACVEISGFILSLFATARLGGLLAAYLTSNDTSGIWFWLFIDVAGTLAISFGFLMMAQARRFMYFSFVRWSTLEFHKTLCRIDLGDYFDEERRNMVNKAGQGYTWQMSELAGENLDLIYAIMRFIAITIVVSQITWWIIPLIALFLLPTLAAESRLASMQWFVWDEKGDQRHVFWGLDYLIKQARGQMELRSTQARQYVLRKLSRMNEDFYGKQESYSKQATRALIPTKILEVVGTSVGAVILLKQFLARSISLERYLFLSGALLRIGGALNNIFSTLSRMQEKLLFADNYYRLIDLQAEVVDTDDAMTVKNVVPEIEFKNVSFTYPGQDKPVFSDLNLLIRPGEHVALVGENGAGKSTLIKLLLRFYRPSSGQILVNGVDIKDVAIESWYRQIATLFQQFNTYPFSIGENITVGNSQIKPNQKLLREAADFSGVTELVDDYPHGWDTVLDSSFEKGIEPSGGQWQRVALARAFYRRANVIILDEPTSAIDAKAEYTIFNNIFKHYKKTSALIVSHRFSTVRRADRIVVLDHGKVVEQGSHVELMNKRGQYHDLFTKQAEGYTT